MTKAKYMSEPINFCPNCGARTNTDDVAWINVATLAAFYQKKNQNIALEPSLSIKVQQAFDKKVVGHKKTTELITMRNKKIKPKKTVKTIKIIKNIPIFVAKCGLCGATLAESLMTDIFHAELKDGKLVPIEEAKPTDGDKETKEVKEVPPAE